MREFLQRWFRYRVAVRCVPVDVGGVLHLVPDAFGGWGLVLEVWGVAFFVGAVWPLVFA